jgi:hypothetical protein
VTCPGSGGEKNVVAKRRKVKSHAHWRESPGHCAGWLILKISVLPFFTTPVRWNLVCLSRRNFNDCPTGSPGNITMKTVSKHVGFKLRFDWEADEWFAEINP